MMNDDTYNRIAIFFLFIIIIGIIGNVLNIIVFSRKSMRNNTTFRFLLYLAVFDLLILVNCAIDGLLIFLFNIELRIQSTFACRFHTFFTYFLTHLSSVVLMTVNIERVCVVCNRKLSKFYSFLNSMSVRNLTLRSKTNNEKHVAVNTNENDLDNLSDFYDEKSMAVYNLKRFVKKNRVDIVMSFVILLLILVNAHFLFNLNVNDKEVEPEKHANVRMHQQEFLPQQHEEQPHKMNTAPMIYQSSNLSLFYKTCYPLSGSPYFYFLKKVWVWIDISIYSLIPFVCMTFCSFIILVKINRQIKILKNSKNTNKLIALKRKKRNTQTLIMLIATNLYFVICSLPYSISYNLFNREDPEGQEFSQSLIQVLAYSNNAFNYIFYGILSEKYRKEFKCLFKKTAREPTETHFRTSMTVSKFHADENSI